MNFAFKIQRVPFDVINVVKKIENLCLPGSYIVYIYHDGWFIGEQNQDPRPKFMTISLNNNLNWALKDIYWVPVSHVSCTVISISRHT